MRATLFKGTTSHGQSLVHHVNLNIGLDSIARTTCSRRTLGPVQWGSGSGSGKTENWTQSLVQGSEKSALNRTEPDFGNTILSLLTVVLTSDFLICRGRFFSFRDWGSN